MSLPTECDLFEITLFTRDSFQGKSNAITVAFMHMYMLILDTLLQTTYCYLSFQK